MTEATVKDLFAFPVKGARGERRESLNIDRTRGVRGDRRFAIKRDPSQPDGWATKVHFRVCMNTPQMARQVPVFRSSAAASASSGEMRSDIGLDPGWLAELAAALDEPAMSTLDTKGEYNLVDTNPHRNGPTVSFLNLASVRALGAATGWTIDPQRFRMNVWYDDGQPFSELLWANDFPGTREVAIGELHLRINDACERCQAIEANPATGERDLPLLAAIDQLLRQRGYRGSPHRGVFWVMGFLAIPLGDGLVRPGDRVRLFSPEPTKPFAR